MMNAYNSTYGGVGDVFVTKLNSTGTGLIYSTYLGGSGLDWAMSIVVDNYNFAFITGYTNSNNFPTKNAYKPTYSGGT